MMRMVLEITMVLALLGGVMYVMKTMAEESKRDKALAEREKAERLEAENASAATDKDVS